MIQRKRTIIILILVILFLGFSVIRINTFSPVGAIRYKCLSHGYIVSAYLLHADKTDINKGDGVTVYKITSFIPYEKPTATYLDQWNVIKNKNGTYSAAYGVG